ncbi:CRISPR system precrRNA processing endoribonuclease RAMP protein Cas6 [Thermincola potens]|uniref:CRISPR-associated protein Cas6 C-terminal domain-containing protein n=1 Tax=Thermincola potens (strain JR) TaxID=635013 RepID=D5X8I6_THEPJ|nr:CRISPR system precrRNA processing endoribonuclease RAMP protein Cas6 [Thermincola potens]ADG82862.1 Protein of unknown function DUF2276 [Thermincola potens JR]
MLRRLKILLEPDREEKCHYNMASLFHGMLMERVNPSYAGYLHESGYKPFSQFVSGAVGNGLWMWTVSFLTEQAWQEVGRPLLDDKAGEFILKDKDIRLTVREKRLEPPVSYGELTRKYYLEEQPRRAIKITFLTPCSFKSAGRYAILPDLALIYQSLMNRFDAFADEFSLRSTDALEHLARFTYIRRYDLRSTRYHLEGVKIPSFIGKLELAVNGPETMAGLANLLFAFGQWAGIGIKTALGMGAVQIE